MGPYLNVMTALESATGIVCLKLGAPANVPRVHQIITPETMFLFMRTPRPALLAANREIIIGIGRHGTGAFDQLRQPGRDFRVLLGHVGGSGRIGN